MSATRWRNLSLVLGSICVIQLWRSCSQTTPPTAVDDRPARVATRSDCVAADRLDRRGSIHPPEPAPASQPSSAAPAAFGAYGFTVPSWALWLAPHPGEDMRAYRDRMLPLAQAVIAPQRARVARGRDSFAALVNLDAHQRAELDAAAQDTAAAVQDRVMTAVLGGELAPSTFKPMTGIGVARELLDIVANGNRRFIESLRDDQRAKLAQHPFDFADYLVFSTRWEDALKLLD